MIRLFNGDCEEIMSGMDDNIIDLTVTSPPYDNLREYNGAINGWGTQKWEAIISILYRITKPGGVVVWVANDATINGSETGTSFKQALFAMKCGFNLHDTMIYKKNSYPFPPSNRYYQQFEYMFVLSKGTPKTANIQTQKTIYKKKTHEVSTTRNKDGETTGMKYEKGKEQRKMDNVWEINTGYMRTTKDTYAYKHPAMFPEELAYRHILTWSNEMDVVLDPMMGSGTTGKISLELNRSFIGIEKDPSYYDICEKRIALDTGLSFFKT